MSHLKADKSRIRYHILFHYFWSGMACYFLSLMNPVSRNESTPVIIYQFIRTYYRNEPGGHHQTSIIGHVKVTVDDLPEYCTVQ